MYAAVLYMYDILFAILNKSENATLQCFISCFVCCVALRPKSTAWRDG